MKIRVSSPRVKIAALVSNESLYLPQWIFHHIYFGINSFDLYINRCSDNTPQVIEKLKTRYPFIRTHDANWIDKFFKNSPPDNLMLYGCYTQDYCNTQDNIDYIFYCDVDEFYLPLNWSDSIQKLIASTSYPDVIYLQWYVIGSSPYYCLPLFSHTNFYGSIWKYFKHIIKTGLPIDIITAHYPCIQSVDRVSLSNGYHHTKQGTLLSAAFSDDQAQLPSNYYLLHNHCRTLVNNLAKISYGAVGALGKPNNPNPVVKWRSIPRQMKKEPDSFILENRLPDSYYMGFKQLMDELNLYEDLKSARLHEYLHAIETLRFFNLHKDSVIYKTYFDLYGQFEDIFKSIFEEMSLLYPAFKNLDSVAFKTPETLVTSSKEDTIKNFSMAVSLYPFAKTNDGRPLFLSNYISYLLANDDYALAMKAIEEDNNKWNFRKYNYWYLPQIIEYLESHNKNLIPALLYDKRYSYQEPIQKYMSEHQDLLSSWPI